MIARLRSWDTNYKGSQQLKVTLRQEACLAKKPSYEVSKDHCFVGLVISWRRGDTSRVPQISLPFIEPLVACLGVDEQDPWGSFNEPSTVDQPNASSLHAGNSFGEFRVCGGQGFDFDGSRGTIERADECVAIAIFGRGDRCL